MLSNRHKLLTQNGIDESQTQKAEQQKPDAKKVNMYDSLYINFKNRKNYSKKNQDGITFEENSVNE